MTTEDIQRLLADLPSGRELTIIIARATDETSGDSQFQAPGSSKSRAIVASGLSRPSNHGTTAAVTPVVLARNLHRGDPGIRPSVNEWHTHLQGALSVREMVRAVKARALAAEPRGSGRGHAAMVITSSSMIEYLETRERVIQGDLQRPAWFSGVIRGGCDANN